MTESVERSTARYHASIAASDAKRDAARGKLEAEVRRSLDGLLEGRNIAAWTPLWHSKAMPIADCFSENLLELSPKDRSLVTELLAIAYACSIGDDTARAKAVALITRLTDEHVQTHLDAAVEE